LRWREIGKLIAELKKRIPGNKPDELRRRRNKS